MAIPEILIVKIGKADADLEIRGIRAVAIEADERVCIGVCAPLPAASALWLMRATSLLAASEAAVDFALSVQDRDYVLWRSYGAMPTALADDRAGRASMQLRSHLALARYIGALGQKAARVRPAIIGSLA